MKPHLLSLLTVVLLLTLPPAGAQTSRSPDLLEDAPSSSPLGLTSAYVFTSFRGTTTRDFVTFTESRLFYDPGFNVIDATLLRAAGKYHLLCFDHYTAPHYYGAVRSRDLRTWEDCSKEMSFPAGHRHGSILLVTADELRKLREWPSQSELP